MADDGEIGSEHDPAPATPSPRSRRGPFVALVVVLAVVVVAAGAVWWTHRSHDLPTGSRHRVTIVVRDAHPGDCMNNIDDITVDGHHFFTRVHAPEAWGTGNVTGTLVVTAPPGPGATATFTADGSDESVLVSGGFTGRQFSDLSCTVS